MLNQDTNNIYTFFNGKEYDLAKSHLGDLIECQHYNCPLSMLDTFVFDNVWREYTWGGSKY